MTQDYLKQVAKFLSIPGPFDEPLTEDQNNQIAKIIPQEKAFPSFTGNTSTINNNDFSELNNLESIAKDLPKTEKTIDNNSSLDAVIKSAPNIPSQTTTQQGNQ